MGCASPVLAQRTFFKFTLSINVSLRLSTNCKIGSIAAIRTQSPAHSSSFGLVSVVRGTFVYAKRTLSRKFPDLGICFGARMALLSVPKTHFPEIRGIRTPGKVDLKLGTPLFGPKR